MPARSGRFAHPGALVVYAALLAILASPPAEAGSYSVEPVQIFLTGARTSTSLSLRNAGEEPLRLQLAAFAWDQGSDGSIRLSPTGDVLFFPKLLSIAAGEQRRIRVAVTVPPGPVERTYRLILEELLPPESARRSMEGIGARIVTKTSVPVFLAPARPAAGGRIAAPRVDRSLLTLDVLNTGNVHLLPQTIRISGLDARGTVVFEREIAGWYVLAAGTRRYAVPIPLEVCRGLERINIEVRTAGAVFAERVNSPAASCAG